MARIAIGGFLHETNCFVPMRTDYEYYARGGDFPPLARGEEIIERTRGSSYGMSGFLDEMLGRHELVPLIWGHAGAGGYVTDDAFERIVGELVGGLSRALPLDAMYLDLHGAMCSETFEAVYLTYPHVDRQHTGACSARILERVLEIDSYRPKPGTVTEFP